MGLGAKSQVMLAKPKNSSNHHARKVSSVMNGENVAPQILRGSPKAQDNSFQTSPNTIGKNKILEYVEKNLVGNSEMYMSPRNGSLKIKMSQKGSFVDKSPGLSPSSKKISKKKNIRMRDSWATQSGQLELLPAKHRRSDSDAYMQTAVAQLIPDAHNSGKHRRNVSDMQTAMAPLIPIARNSGNYSNVEYVSKMSSRSNRQSTKNIAHDLTPVNQRLSNSVDFSVSQARERLLTEMDEGKKSQFEKYKTMHNVPDEISDPANGVFYSRGSMPRDNHLMSSPAHQIRNSWFSGAKNVGVQRILDPAFMGIEDLI